MKVDIKELVRRILVQFPDARDSDKRLMIRYCHAIGYSLNKSYYDVLCDKDAPNFESLGRIRRKVQQEHEELRGSEWIQNHRQDKQADYIAFAHDGQAEWIQ